MAILDLLGKSKATIQSYVLRLIAADTYCDVSESHFFQFCCCMLQKTASEPMTAVFFFYTECTKVSSIYSVGKNLIGQVPKGIKLPDQLTAVIDSPEYGVP